MLIERNIIRFVVFAGDTVLTALNKISENKQGFVIALSDSGHVRGMITDGDIRRWLSRSAAVDLNADAGDVANTDCQTAAIDTAHADLAGMFSERVRVVPLVDSQKRLVAIAMPSKAEIAIGDRRIGKGYPSYVIAEIGNNHNGDIDLAFRLVDLAKEAGADCAKFQLRDLSSLYGGGQSSDANQDLGSQYTMDLLSRFNLTADQLFKVFDYAVKQGITPLCTPWDLHSLQALERYGVLGYKTASADLTNHEFLRHIAATGKPMICSTGMSTEAEIQESVRLLQASASPFVLLHCNSTYPTPYKDVNLRYLTRLGELGGCPVGYSGHERGWSVPIAAVTLGASVIEKHFTIDRGMEGSDHKVSLLPDEFAEMIRGIRAVEASLGEGGKGRALTQGEMMNREVLAKSLVAACDIEPGTVVTEAMIAVQSPGQGLQPNQRGALIGRKVTREIKARTPFFPSDLVGQASEPRDFNFRRPWGLPARWHDKDSLLKQTNMDIIEYHLSYKDMEAPLEKWFGAKADQDLVVHAPELFEGDHVLDLASLDPEYRARSISELQRVIDLTRKLRQWHSTLAPTPIIVNMGGFTESAPLPVTQRAELYALVEDSLAQLDCTDVELIPQTMPPFPWHFGGQRYHNLFMDPQEIAAFCEKHGMRMCFDVSHSQLACNEFGWSMKEFTEIVSRHTAHLHMADATGVDGEGLQIGAGTMDFAAIAQVLDRNCPEASFIPEVWQGHKDNGSGFWFALDQLEKWMGHPAAQAAQEPLPVR